MAALPMESAAARGRPPERNTDMSPTSVLKTSRDEVAVQFRGRQVDGTHKAAPMLRLPLVERTGTPMGYVPVAAIVVPASSPRLTDGLGREAGIPRPKRADDETLEWQGFCGCRRAKRPPAASHRFDLVQQPRWRYAPRSAKFGVVLSNP
jgi:hypothetical protein